MSRWVPEPARQCQAVARFVWSHPANRRARARSLARALAFQLRGRTGRRTLARIGDSGRMWAHLHSHASSAVVYANPPDWNAMLAWRRLLSPGDLFVDVGSNVGSYAMWAGDVGASVVAIEPHPEAYLHLCENASLNDFEVTTMRCALGEHPGSMRLTSDLGTLNHLVLGDEPGGAVIEVSTLDRVLGERTAKGVKIDVEGAERLVLRGGETSLREGRISFLQLEWNRMSEDLLGEDRTPIAKILADHGYSFYRPDEDGRLRPASPDGYGPDIFAAAPGAVDGANGQHSAPPC